MARPSCSVAKRRRAEGHYLRFLTEIPLLKEDRRLSSLPIPLDNLMGRSFWGLEKRAKPVIPKEGSQATGGSYKYRNFTFQRGVYKPLT